MLRLVEVSARLSEQAVALRQRTGRRVEDDGELLLTMNML
jgi:hypothetical protein